MKLLINYFSGDRQMYGYTFIFDDMKPRSITFNPEQLKELAGNPPLAVAFINALEYSPKATTSELFAAARAMMRQYDLFKQGKEAFAAGGVAVRDAAHLSPEELEVAQQLADDLLGSSLRDAAKARRAKH